jgi:glycosyltransferase involved in cell wall biosynthesis
VRIAIFNRHWSTLGGGEQVAAGFATALGQRHDVDLLVVEPFEPDNAGDRLGVDLRGFRQCEIPEGTRAFLEATAPYDVVVNTSFASTFPTRSRHGVYYVHFPRPHAPIAPVTRWLSDTLGDWIGTRRAWIECSEGFWLPEFPGAGRWTLGAARMDLVVPRGERARFGFTMSGRYWPLDQAPSATVTVDGDLVFSGVLDRGGGVSVRATITGRGVDDPIPVVVSSDTFSPRLELGYDDDRSLGVVVSHAFIGRPTIRGLRRVSARLPQTFVPDFLDSYDAIVANSPYTSAWVSRLWGRDADVLAPPVPPRPVGIKGPVILAVGRFFPNRSGHSKKQLELVDAFRLAVDRGLTGWELCLVGGCSNEERHYVEQVRKAAVGLPVRFFVNAAGEDVADLFARASIFWHGAGFGEDVDRHPDRLEHFGIGVVEAMSAGAAPVVYARGGPAAIVVPGRTGEHFTTLDELARLTIDLARDPQRRERLATAAHTAASEFGSDHFARRARALVERVSDGEVVGGRSTPAA